MNERRTSENSENANKNAGFPTFKEKRNATKKGKRKMKTYSIIKKNVEGQFRGDRTQLNCNLSQKQAYEEIREMAEIHAYEVEMSESDAKEFISAAAANGGFHDGDVSYYFIEEEEE